MPKIDFKSLVLLETDNYLVINKPPFLASLSDRNSRINVLDLARVHHDDVHLCHRLDKETSGVLVIAKNAEAYRSASLQFQKREVGKIYKAVVNGVHTFENEEVDLPILNLSKGVVKISNKGKAALTFFKTERVFRSYTTVNCYPITGRTHQIRIHLSSIGAPIVADRQYGGEDLYLSRIKRNYNLKKGTSELPLISRVALHAKQIQFLDLDGSELIVDAPYPKDFAVLLKQLEAHG